jgi:predicted aldo/keto reductase-like oxidoreductase
VEIFDYYLIHNLGENSYRQACKYDTFGCTLNKKKEGRIKQLGFSFHATPELLDEILTAHPEVDFVQLQINYIDWENPGIQSRKCYEVARKHHVPVIVMEPCKGGNLAQVPARAEALMKAYNSNASIPSWAIRFAASLEGVIMVLSGMSTLDQVLDNIAYMAEFQPLNAEETRIINQVTDIINEDTAVPCTTCRYCEAGCPKNMPSRITLPYITTPNAPLAIIFPVSCLLSKPCRHPWQGRDCTGCKQCEKRLPAASEDHGTFKGCLESI